MAPRRGWLGGWADLSVALYRLVYDGRGRLTWRYRLLRLARAPGVRTRLLDAFLSERGGAAYLAHG